MKRQPEASSQNHTPPFGEGAAAIAGCVGGIVGGVPLGAIVAWLTVQQWSVTAMIVVAHVTVAMVAMGAWAAPSLLAKIDSPETPAPQAPAAPPGPTVASDVRPGGRDPAPAAEYRGDREMQP